MSFKIIAILVAACASGAALAQQDKNHDHQKGDSRSSSHTRQDSTSRSSSSSSRSSGSGSRQGSGSHSNNGRSQDSNRSRSDSNGYSGRSSYGYTRSSGDTNRSNGSSNHTSGATRWHQSENRSSGAPLRSDFGEVRRTQGSGTWNRGSDHGTTSGRNSDHGTPRQESNNHWSDRYTGGSRDNHRTGTTNHSGSFDRDHSSSSSHGTFGSFGGHNSNGGSRVFDRGRLFTRDTFVHQSRSWGGGWRSGWERRSGFGLGLAFGFYLSDRFAAPCYVSPWYYYGNLPPYIPASHCYVVDGYNCDWSAGAVYNWSDRNNYGEQALDDAIHEIEDAYRDQNLDAVDRLVPSYGDVAISTDGHYDYSLKSGEFGQMFSDSIKGTDTVSFHVDQVRRYGSYATVRCSHEIEGPEGQETVYQTYRLKMQDGRFVVTDFMTEHSSEF